jgi:hypothetical protein
MNWICDDRLDDISGVEYCNDEDRMNAVARDFADGSNHLFSGCIGAVDGWIVKIKKTMQERRHVEFQIFLRSERILRTWRPGHRG